MSLSFVLQVFLPTLVPLAAGYAMARYLGLTPAPLRTLLRFVLAPPLLFALTLTTLQSRSWLVLLGVGAGIVAAVMLALPALSRVTKLKLDGALTMPNILAFTLPFMALSWNVKSSGKVAAAVIFVGAAVTLAALQLRERTPKALIKEPWVYGVAAALVFKLLELPSGPIYKGVGALAEAAYPIGMLYIGTMLFPLESLRDKDAWLAVGARMALALVVAVLVTQLMPLSKNLAEAAVLCALAPPASGGTALARPGDKESGNTSVGVAASLIGALVLLMGPWFK
jgi:predicted permease